MLILCDVVTKYKHTENYLKRKTIENYVKCFFDWPPAENFFGITLRLGYQAQNYAFASNIKMSTYMASSFLNSGSKPCPYRFLIIFFLQYL